jgi:hypothetical protein
MITVVLVKETKAELIHKSRAIAATAAIRMPMALGLLKHTVSYRDSASAGIGAPE